MARSLLRLHAAPDAYDRVELAYNRQGQPIWIKDQRGVIREFEYDGLGRFLADKATTIPTGVDDAIQRIERSYGSMGWTENITSRVGTGGAATIANQVNLAYNGFGQVLKSRQAHSGSANTSTIGVGYTYADGDLMSRLASMAYPQGSSVVYTYATGLDASISRISALTVSSADIVEYSYLGYNTPVVVDYSADPGIRLDYTLGGDSGSETYKSFDRFGRVTLHNWVKTVGQSDVDIIKIAHAYDRVSNRTSRDDQVALPAAVKRDEIYSYDKLNRVLQNLRGTIVSGSISSPAETEKWALDPLGNWTTYQFDGDGDGAFTSAADLNDARSYDSPAGLANEITEWDPYPANSQNNPVEPVYDRAGNMTDDNYQYVYTYDAWNRLVKVEDQGVTPAVVGAYGYDGLNRRITRTIGSDDAIHEYYTESWQRIESRPGGESSTQGVSLFVFGIRYIDDIIMRQRDANENGPPEERRYFLTDANYNVAMLVTDTGWGVERVFYTAYGEPEVFPFGDADGDYDVDTADETLITAIKNGSQPYNILADLNLDGAVTQADLNAFSAYSGALGGRNVLTASNGSATTGNDIGYAGYTWNDERSQWHVRHREYDPKLGRWLQRDPEGYLDTTNAYQYARSAPSWYLDPLGLSSGPVYPPPFYNPNQITPLRDFPKPKLGPLCKGLSIGIPIGIGAAKFIDWLRNGDPNALTTTTSGPRFCPLGQQRYLRQETIMVSFTEQEVVIRLLGIKTIVQRQMIVHTAKRHLVYACCPAGGTVIEGNEVKRETDELFWCEEGNWFRHVTTHARVYSLFHRRNWSCLGSDADDGDDGAKDQLTDDGRSSILHAWNGCDAGY